MRTHLQLLKLESRILPSLTVPAYNSLPGAQASVYLNFSGDFISSWGGVHNISIPPFAGGSGFWNMTALSTIYQIWQNVSEDYSPFSVNVTTARPTGGEVSQIDVGGDGSWLGATYGGIAQIGGLANSSPANPTRGFVFPVNLSNSPKFISDGAAHEAGHTFGLYHQSQWNGNTLVATYYAGPGDGTAPTMGNPYSATRSLWWYGTSEIGPTSIQNDMAVIAGNALVGFRPDDHGNTMATADPLTVSNGLVSGSGVIEKMSDVDYFSFDSGPGVISLTVGHPSNSVDLSPLARLYDADGNLLASALPDASFNDTINVTVEGGTYYLSVTDTGRSSGSTPTSYGQNVGQYIISGTVVSQPTWWGALSSSAVDALFGKGKHGQP
jgi:serralysin